MSETDKQMTEDEYRNRLRNLRAEIDRANAESHSRLRDRLYKRELELIEAVEGSQPCVGGWDPKTEKQRTA